MVVKGQVKCYHCGFISGEMEGEIGVPLYHWSFRPNPVCNEPSSVSRTLRCCRCGGPAYLDEIETVRPRPVEEPLAFLREGRRGRKRKGAA